MREYKVRIISNYTSDRIEDTINEFIQDGWILEHYKVFENEVHLVFSRPLIEPIEDDEDEYINNYDNKDSYEDRLYQVNKPNYCMATKHFFYNCSHDCKSCPFNRNCKSYDD